jgi:hypothetical protein
MKSSASRLKALAVTLPLIVLGWAPSAFAVEPPAAPTGDYALFGDCPVSAPGIADCLVTQTTGGQLTFGKATVPIDRTITIQGGLATEPVTEALAFVPAADGQTLSHTPLEVPGGLLNLIDRRDLATWSHGGFNRWSPRAYTVTATLELVGPVQVNILNILLQEGSALVLPVRIRLANPLLGGGCHIGSGAEPITLNMIDGTTSPPPPNEPISGTPGSLSIANEGAEAILSASVFVDNSFAVPQAEGCGPAGVFDNAIDRQLELPSASGANTAIMDSTETLAAVAAVLASEE